MCDACTMMLLVHGVCRLRCMVYDGVAYVVGVWCVLCVVVGCCVMWVVWRVLIVGWDLMRVVRC